MRRINRHKQAGFVLAVSMIFLIVMTMLAVTAIKKATLDEKVSLNLRAQDLGFQAAEKALRFCERQLELAIASSKSCKTQNGIEIIALGEPDVSNPMSSFPMQWATMSNWADGTDKPGMRLLRLTVDSAPGGADRELDRVPGVVTQPQCMIERWAVPGSGGAGRYPYVITARGVGSMDTAVVWLQVMVRCGNF